MSDYQQIFCARKVKRTKFNEHSNEFLRSLKHYMGNFFVEVTFFSVNDSVANGRVLTT